MVPLVSLRPATADDGPFLASVYASTREDELALTDWDDGQKSAFCRMQSDAQTEHYRRHYLTAEYLVVEADHHPVGRLFLDRWAREIRIMDIAILPGHRGQGIGARLLGDLRNEAESCGKILSIHVERMNPALSLYQRLGFRVAEDKGVYLLMEWRPECELT